MNHTRQELEKRKNEILAQLTRVNEDLQMKLDRDPEEQAIQLEQDEVTTTMEANLQRELIEIEEQMLGLKE